MLNRARKIYLNIGKKFVKRSDDLIYDLGANDGRDTAFYLAKGFRVVAIEANPILADKLAARFSAEIQDGRLLLLHLGLSEGFGVAPFYINEGNDHWSSFSLAYGGRDGTAYRTVSIKTFPLSYVLSRYGCPYYMKIDVEGFDKSALLQLRDLPAKPQYISFEEYGVEGLSDAAALGYNRFFLAKQSDKSWAVPPNPALEGRFVDQSFDGRDSGLFGRELPGPWLSFDEAVAFYVENVRARDGSWKGPQGEWYDVHATIG